MLQQRVVVLGPPRRVGKIIDQRVELSASGSQVQQQRIELEGDVRGRFWVALSETPHVILPANTEDAEVIDGGEQKIDLHCVITHQRLTNPARGESCTHMANADYGPLCEYVKRTKRCPNYGCDAAIRRFACPDP